MEGQIAGCSETLQVSLRQLRSRRPWVLGDDLLQNAFDLVGMTQTAFHIRQFVQRVRHLGVFRVQLTDFGKRLTGTLKVAFGQIHFPKPVLGVARILAVRVFAGTQRTPGWPCRNPWP